MTSDGRAYLWGQWGGLQGPVPWCDFCSLGEAWGVWSLVRAGFLGSRSIESVRDYAENKVRWIVLRTTGFYSLEILSELVESTRAVPEDMKLARTLGEFDLEKANALHRWCGLYIPFSEAGEAGIPGLSLRRLENPCAPSKIR